MREKERETGFSIQCNRFSLILSLNRLLLLCNFSKWDVFLPEVEKYGNLSFSHSYVGFLHELKVANLNDCHISDSVVHFILMGLVAAKLGALYYFLFANIFLQLVFLHWQVIGFKKRFIFNTTLNYVCSQALKSEGLVRLQRTQHQVCLFTRSSLIRYRSLLRLAI